MTREEASKYLRGLAFSIREEFIPHSKARMNNLQAIADIIDDFEEELVQLNKEKLHYFEKYEELKQRSY